MLVKYEFQLLVLPDLLVAGITSFCLHFIALRQQKQSSPVSAGSQQSLQDSSKLSHQSIEELPMTPSHVSANKIESML